MFRSFKCVEISLTDQTPGPETLSKVGVWIADFVDIGYSMVYYSNLCDILHLRFIYQLAICNITHAWIS